ncbi:MAG: hypothetical protein HY042_12100 [Spirochaetia bacterium]|nr:hypothetical protein [Spirochaetia bacterium]
MRKTAWLVLLICFSVASAEDSSFIIKRFPRRVHVVFTLKPQAAERGSFTQLMILPVPRSDEKREIKNVQIHMSQGMKPDIKAFPETGDLYLPLLSQGSLRDEVTIEYDAVLYSIHYRLPRGKDILPYDKGSTTYKLYTGKDQRFEPGHPEIKRIADDLWNQSRDIVEYAHKAYAWEQKNLKWKNTGNYASVTDIFANGGGDCGALTAIYVSLMRAKGIPARAQIGGVIQGSDRWEWHVWPEFYLEKKGWVETDPSYFTSPPGFFAYDDAARIHFHRASTVTVEYGDFKFQTGGIQRYAYYTRGASRSMERAVESLMGDNPVNYNVTVNVETKSSPMDDGGLNSEAQTERTTSRLIDLINKKRADKGLPALQSDPGISRALTQTLSGRDMPTVKERRITDQDCRRGCTEGGVLERGGVPIGDSLKEQNVQLRKYSWERFSVGFHALDPVPRAADAVNEKTLMNSDWKQVGVGYYFDPAERAYRFAVLFGIRK